MAAVVAHTSILIALQQVGLHVAGAIRRAVEC